MNVIGQLSINLSEFLIILLELTEGSYIGKIFDNVIVNVAN
jgi:hypothetical protein